MNARNILFGIGVPIVLIGTFLSYGYAAPPAFFHILPDNGAGAGHTKDSFFVKGVADAATYVAQWSVPAETSSCVASGAWSGTKSPEGEEDLVIPDLSASRLLTYTLMCPSHKSLSSEIFYLIPDVRSSNDILSSTKSQLKDVSIQNLVVEQQEKVSLAFDVVIGHITGGCNNLHQNVGFDVLVDGEPVLFRLGGSSTSARRVIFEETDHSTVRRLTLDPLGLASGQHTLSVRVSFAVLHGSEPKRVMGRFSDSPNEIFPDGVNSMSFAIAASDKIERQVLFSLGQPGPNAPSNVTAAYTCNGSEANGSYVTLHWTDNSFNEDGFRIYRRKALESAFAVLASVPPGTTSLVDSSVGAPGVYIYKVEAFNQASVAMSEETSVSAGSCVQGDFTISSDFKIITMLQPFPNAGLSFSSPVRFSVHSSGGFHEDVRFSVTDIIPLNPGLVVQDISAIFEPDETVTVNEYSANVPVRFRIGISSRTRVGSYNILLQAQDPSGAIVRNATLRLDVVDPNPGR